MTHARLAPAVVAACSLVFSAGAAAAPGDLDPSFDGDGVVEIEASSPSISEVEHSPDGPIVVMVQGDDGLQVRRFLRDGSVDPSFGANGRVELEREGSPSARTLRIGVDGSVTFLVGGDVVRLTPNGQPDPAFGTNGLVKAPFPASNLAVHADGKVVLAGVLDKAFALAQLASSGELDPSFSGDGIVRTTFGRVSSRGEYVVALPGGAVVAAGVSEQPLGQAALAVLRVGHDGAFDPSFSGDGATEVEPLRGQLRALSADAAGRLFVGHAFGAIRLQPDGSVDQSFVTPEPEAFGFGSISAATPSGERVYVVGNIAGCETGFVCDENDVGLARFDAQGGLDSSFGRAGVARVDLGDTPFADDVAVAADGRVVVTSNEYFGRRVFLARYLDQPGPADADADGVLDADDRCPRHHGPSELGGCPQVPRNVSMHVSGGGGRLAIWIKSGEPACKSRKRVHVFRRKRGRDEMINGERTDESGFAAARANRPGVYYATTPRVVETYAGVCPRSRTRPVRYQG